VWNRKASGLILTFHLAGINNQNFLMRDDQTRTFWQQISGKAVSGPLAGSQLTLVYSDELTFDLWRKLEPDGSVLLPVPGFVPEYETKDWEDHMAKARTVLDFPDTPLKSRDLVLGIQISGESRAYVVNRILDATLIEDWLGGEPLLIVTGPDRKSIRAFRAKLDDGEAVSEFYRMPDPGPGPNPVAAVDVKAPLFMDAATGSEWNFDGCAVSGKSFGRCLTPVSAVKDYWFDWRNYHPDTSIFKR
jgi:hypothetical protein